MTGRDQDSELIAGLVRGDSAAVTTVDGWVRRAALPFRRRLSSQWDDLLQDLHLEVFRLLKEGRFRGQSSLKSYLWQVVGHSCVDRIRSAQRWRWTDLEETVTADLEHTAASQRLPSWNPVRDLLMRVLERIPQGCRRLLTMIVAGLSYKEMSDRVGSSEGALRVRVLRCRQQAHRIRAELLAQRGCNETPSPDAVHFEG